jgi:hypothetical protein
MARENEKSSKPLKQRLKDTLTKTWHFGFTSFGGPSVHFQIVGFRRNHGNFSN